MSARVRVDDYRRRALELVNSGQAQAESLPGSLVTACGAGAYVEVGVWVAATALEPKAWLVLCADGTTHARRSTEIDARLAFIERQPEDKWPNPSATWIACGPHRVVPEPFVLPRVRCKCWRRFGPCARCAEVEPQQSGPLATLLDAVGAETLL